MKLPFLPKEKKKGNMQCMYTNIYIYIDRDFLEATDFSGFRAPEKLKLDWLAKRMSSDSFTISDERI